MAGSAPPLIKFCGMTQPADAAYARSLGASYVGVIFADSPRKVDEKTARAVFDAAGPLERVVVFANESPIQIGEIARSVDANVVQLHGRPATSQIAEIRDVFRGEIWAVLSIDAGNEMLPAETDDLADAADALLLDSRVEGRSGGTGTAFTWGRLAESARRLGERTRLILAGGLNAENVAEGVRLIRPAIVDVSSGVEISPGIKNRESMKAFAEAVRSASIDGRNGPPRGTQG